MSFIQYVGETERCKVFVYISHCFYKNADGAYSCMVKGDNSIIPIDPSEYNTWIHHTPISGRLEVQECGDIFIADEAHRDAYPFHLSGYLKIKDLKIGEIIPINGFHTPDFLSETDKKIIANETTVMDIKRAKLAEHKNLTAQQAEFFK